MSQIAEAFVRVRPDASGFGRELERQTEPQLNRFENQLKGSNRELTRFSRGALVGTGALGGLGRAAAFASASFIGGAGLVYGIKSAIGAASNLAEQTSKTKVVFDEAAESVIAFSNDALLLARDQALETASSIGALLRPLGVLPDQAAKTSITLTKLGVDLSSFYNTSVADALNAIRSGLVGEVEPLRRYGVVLSEARVQQAALVETGKQSVDQLTNQEKVLARVNLILRDTSKAHGDAERTSGGFANQTRELQKNIRNTEILIGQTLIPTLTGYLVKGNEWLSQTKNQERIQRDVNQAVKVGATALDILATAIKGVSDAYQFLHDQPGGDKGLIQILADDHGQISRTGHLIGGALFEIADAIGHIADSEGRLNTAEDLLWASRKRHGLQPATGIFGVPQTVLNAFGAGIPAPTPRGKKVGGAGEFVTPSDPGSRNDVTATALAAAQASGNRAAITAAANARLAFIRDTIAFANKLIAEGRGDTAKLYGTLQQFYGEQASIDGIFDQFAADDERAAAQRLADAKARAAKANARRAALADKLKRFLLPGKVPGLIDPGNIDLFHRRIALLGKSIATVRTASISTDKGETLIPTIINGKSVSLEQAIEHFRKTGDNLGTFATIAEANAYAERLHLQQQRYYAAAGQSLLKIRNAAAKQRLETQSEIQLEILRNNLAVAQLTPGTEAELAAEKKAQRLLVEWYKQRAKNLDQNTLAGQQAQGDYLAALQQFRALGKKEKAETGFTLAELFSEAGQEFKLYGGNVGNVLSPQDARGAFAGTVKTHQTTVVQNFYGERGSGQALADAARVARNMKD